MFNTIALIIVCLIFAVYFIHVLYDIMYGEPNFKNILVLILTFGIILSAHGAKKCIKDEYTKGYNDAIKSAELIKSNDYYYIIDFDGETHYYTIEGNELNAD